MKSDQTQAPNAPENEKSDNRYAAWLAFDWADRKHDVRLHDPATGATEAFEIDHTPEALADFVASLRRRFGARRFALAVELKRGPLLNFLRGYEFIDVYPVKTTTLSWFRKAFHPSGAKSDPLDSELILEILLKHSDRLEAPWKPDAPEVRLLSELTESRRKFVDQATKTAQRLGACLKDYYPLALEILGSNLSSALACDFLTRWPDLDKLRAARPGTIRKFLRLHNCRSEKRLAEVLGLVGKAVPLTRDATVLEGHRMRTLALVKLMRTCLAIIENYDSQIAEVFESCEDADLFKSLPGAGEVLAPRLLCIMGSRRGRFPAPDNLACFSGCAPVTESSGKRKVVHWRWAAPTFVRQSWVEFARWSVIWCPWARAYNELLKERGERGPTRMRKIAFKWTRIVHRCWTDRVPYDEAKHVESLRKTNSPVWRKMQQLAAAEAPDQSAAA